MATIALSLKNWENILGITNFLTRGCLNENENKYRKNYKPRVSKNSSHENAHKSKLVGNSNRDKMESPLEYFF